MLTNNRQSPDKFNIVRSQNEAYRKWGFAADPEMDTNMNKDTSSQQNRAISINEKEIPNPIKP